jgi:hypothetical protein
MARRNHAYAIRLVVQGGGQVEAELVSVGQSGEQSLKRIESAGERGSGGLKGLGRQAELRRTGIRTRGRRSSSSPVRCSTSDMKTTSAGFAQYVFARPIPDVERA